MSYGYCLVPVASLCLVFLLYVYVYQALIACAGVDGCAPVPEIRQQIETHLSQAEEASVNDPLTAFAGRITWAIAIGLSLIFSLCGFVWATYLAAQARRFDGRPFWHNLWPPLAAAVIWLVLKDLPSSGGASVSPWRQFVHSGITGDFADAQEWTRLMDVGGLFVAAYTALALSIYLCSSVQHRARWLAELPRHIRLVNTTLYLGAIILMVGVLRVWSLLYWSLDYFPPDLATNKTLLASLSRVADSIIDSRGLLYTVMLAALYGPAVMLLQHQIREGTRSGELPPVKADATGNFSTTDSVLRFVAVLGPALSGPAADYLELLR